MLALLLALPVCMVRADDADKAVAWVAVMRRGEVFGIDAVIKSPVTLQEAWAVLTDFDAMAAFIPNLESSRVLSRTGDVLRVEQRGALKWGPVSQDYATVREVQLAPMETIRSTSVAGATPREQSLTRFREIAGGTEIWHRAELAFTSWMPDYVAERFLRDVMQQRYEAIVAEMVKRAGRDLEPPAGPRALPR
jgi:hypothetical protein